MIALEILLFLAPFGLYVAWRLLAPALATRWVLAAALVLLAAIAAGGYQYGTRPHLAPGQVYVPPHSEGGQIVPGHGR